MLNKKIYNILFKKHFISLIFLKKLILKLRYNIKLKKCFLFSHIQVSKLVFNFYKKKLF